MQSWVHFFPADKKVKVPHGTSLFEAGRRARVVIRSRCGQKAACLMCKVEVVNQQGLTPRNAQERLKLGEGALNEHVRLSCQAKVIGNVSVTVPGDPLKSIVQAMLQKQRAESDDGFSSTSLQDERDKSDP